MSCDHTRRLSFVKHPPQRGIAPIAPRQLPEQVYMSESEQPGAHKPGQLEEQFRGVLRKMHYSYNTEES